MSACETRTVLDAILWETLSMAHNMAAGIPQIRTDIRGQACVERLLKSTDVSKDYCPERASIGYQEGINLK